MPKPSARHNKYYAERGVEGNKIYIEKHDLNRIQSKVKRPKLYLPDSIQTRISKSDSQSKKLILVEEEQAIEFNPAVFCVFWSGHMQMARQQNHRTVSHPRCGTSLGGQQCSFCLFV